MGSFLVGCLNKPSCESFSSMLTTEHHICCFYDEKKKKKRKMTNASLYRQVTSVKPEVQSANWTKPWLIITF